MHTKIFYTPDRDACLKDIKMAVAEGAEANVPKEYLYLLKEWKESLAAGVVPSKDALPDDTRDLQTFDRVNAFHRYRLAYLDAYYNQRDEAIGALGAAIYYLDNLYSVFRKGGDAELVAKLKDKGMRLGSNFSVENVGVCVANKAAEYPDQVIHRVGSENFIKLFEDYACFAYYWHDEYRDISGTLLALLPLEKCSERAQSAIEFLLNVESVTHDIYYPFTKRRSEYLETYVENRNELVFFLDEHGQVIFASRHFQEVFGKHIADGPPPSITQIMPELSYLTDFFDESRKPCQIREVMLPMANKKHAFFFATPEILHTSRGLRGLRCQLQLAEKKGPRISGSAEGAVCRYSFNEIIGESSKMQEIKSYAAKAAEAGGNVLLLGESGTGKELFAQAIHLASKKKNGPFVPINCASLPKDLLNSELFGYEDGAFTGAKKGGAPGKFEQANGGTIFLDEIGDMPLEMQSALLRVLEDNTIIRIGGKKYIPVDVRVVAATNQDLWANVQKGTFRADLYFRLNIVTIKIPPLRERKDDIPLLVKNILERIQRKYGGVEKTASEDFISMLKGYSWPGNVRELRNVIERSVNYSSERIITTEQLPAEMTNMLASEKNRKMSMSTTEKLESIDDWRGYNKESIIAVLRKYGGNKTKAAIELGVSRATFYKRLKEYGIT